MTKTEEFIKKAKLVHSNENIDYSFVVYKNNRTPVKMIDHDLDENGEEYGEFWQTPYNHLKGQSHPKKRGKKISNTKRGEEYDIIERFKEVHKGENLDYSKVKYVNMHTKVLIISHDLDEDGKEYGEFWQEPIVHLKGCTHPRIGRKKVSESQKYTTDIFVKKCKELYGEEHYNFDQVNYVNSKTKVNIFCNKIGSNGKPHGLFSVSPDLFLQCKGCPKCGNHLSYAEDEIYDIIKANSDIEVIKHDKTILNGKELDLYIPSKNVGIEYNGLRWHSDKFKTDKNYHLNKTVECKKRGIKLIQIFEDEYVNNKDIVIKKILHIVGVGENKEKIYGRKCEIKEINNYEAREFLDKFHIQGFSSSTVYLGAYYNRKLIAVMSFKIEYDNCGKWELNRFASDYNYICCGVGGKLFNYFVNNYGAQEIKSFADRRWTVNEENNIYIQLGFTFDKYLKPEYRYYRKEDGTIRQHKFGFRKQILHKKYGLPLTMTETEMAKELGYDRIWDCGLVKYRWRRE